ncbi:transcriptional regulator FurA [Gordonia spumicola]|uniref:Transcriptional regulator FurA n=1 Tax=Gordonia spumicola TaxID=589161 RepID=A0A7I9VBZ5_9ACTN|nr:Fur family transcriptional regulator [Gordonia spumicola]GEE02896.1 transcriptional regulator FurA [Gordonia spumicola]
MVTDEHAAAIRAAGLRVTKPRLAVMSVVDAHPHSDTEGILSGVRRTLDGVSRQAVYDVLRALTDAGLLRRIQPSGHVSLYETRIADNHHHLVCRVCGSVHDVDCAVGEAPCLAASDEHGFHIDEAEVIYWGVCAACADASDPPAKADPAPHA